MAPIIVHQLSHHLLIVVKIKLQVILHFSETSKNRKFLASSVIQATGMVEFEDDLRTGILPGGFWGPFKAAATGLGSHNALLA